MMKKFTIQFDYFTQTESHNGTDVKNLMIRSAIHTNGYDIADAYKNARNELKELEKVKLGACLNGHILMA